MMDRPVFGGLCQLDCVHLVWAFLFIFFWFLWKFHRLHIIHIIPHEHARSQWTLFIIARFHRLTFIFIPSKKKETHMRIYIYNPFRPSPWPSRPISQIRPIRSRSVCAYTYIPFVPSTYSQIYTHYIYTDWKLINSL